MERTALFSFLQVTCVSRCAHNDRNNNSDILEKQHGERDKSVGAGYTGSRTEEINCVFEVQFV